MTSTPERYDSIGRRIGFNWWREYNRSILSVETAAWEALRESGEHIRGSVAGADDGTVYYQLTDEQFRQLHPRPTLRTILEMNAGMHAR